MEDEFRGRANEEIARLLAHWRVVELWIKRGEQISKNAMIPAINELRYASRQFLNAQRVFAKDNLSNGDKSIIKKRLIVAEQYLLNAEHDVCDTIIVHFDGEITSLDKAYGPGAIATLFPGYPLLKQRIDACQTLIRDARENYENRRPNYNRLRDEHFPQLVEAHRELVDAEVAARQQKAALEREVLLARAKIRALGWFGLFASVCTVVGSLNA